MSEVISWPVTDDEKEACWDLVLSLKERGLDESQAIARAVELVTKDGGRHTTEAMVRGCRPRRKGADTHTHDIGRSIKKHGVEDLEVDGRKEVLQHGEESAAADPEAELMKFGVEVLAMLFRKILPELPARMAKLKPRDGSLTLPPGGSFEAVRVDGGDEDDSDFVAVREPGMLLVKMNGRDVPVLRGAIRTFRAGGQVDRVILNATTRRLRVEKNHGQYLRTRLYYTEWFPGKADWEFSFKQFITYAALFAPGAVNHARAATLARLLGETRAAMSARQVKVAEAYEATGGRAKFQGMRMRKDPRRGQKLGPRNSTNH